MSSCTLYEHDEMNKRFRCLELAIKSSRGDVVKEAERYLSFVDAHGPGETQKVEGPRPGSVVISVTPKWDDI